jgi:hypothetical protein
MNTRENVAMPRLYRDTMKMRTVETRRGAPGKPGFDLLGSIAASYLPSRYGKFWHSATVRGGTNHAPDSPSISTWKNARALLT